MTRPVRRAVDLAKLAHTATFNRSTPLPAPARSPGQRQMSALPAGTGCEVRHKALPQERNGRGYRAAAARGARSAADEDAEPFTIVDEAGTGAFTGRRAAESGDSPSRFPA
jgi:hypothetical protein